MKAIVGLVLLLGLSACAKPKDKGPGPCEALSGATWFERTTGNDSFVVNDSCEVKVSRCSSRYEVSNFDGKTLKLKATGVDGRAECLAPGTYRCGVEVTEPAFGDQMMTCEGTSTEFLTKREVAI